MTQDDSAVLAVPDGFEETHFERGTYGPDDREGFAATIERDTMALRVLPVRYRREDGTEYVDALTEEFEAGRDDPAARLDEVGPTTAFATRADFEPYWREQRAIVFVGASAGDALAVAIWLARKSDEDSDLGRNAQLHAGRLPPSRSKPILSDDDVLGAKLADEPEYCLVTGVETGSHTVTVPYRYVQVLSDVPRSDRGVIRFPTTAEGLVGVVSHSSWTDLGLGDVDFQAPIERESAGTYRLDPDVADLLDGTPFERFALRRL